MYKPTAVPDDTPPALKAWISDELRLIAVALENTNYLGVTGTAPSRPRNGQIVYADGTKWDPGSGEGFYGYENGSWVKF